MLAGVLEETAARVLHAAGMAVTAVDIEPTGEDRPELRSDPAAARVELATAAGTRAVTVQRRVRPETGGRGRSAGPGGR